MRGFKLDWLSDPKAWRTEVLAGLVIALALIPEAISSSIIAGVDPGIGGTGQGCGRRRRPGRSGGVEAVVGTGRHRLDGLGERG